MIRRWRRRLRPGLSRSSASMSRRACPAGLPVFTRSEQADRLKRVRLCIWRRWRRPRLAGLRNRSSSSGARPFAAIVFRTRLESEARKAAVGPASVRFVTRGMLRELTQQELDSWRSFRYMVEETSLRVSRSLMEATGTSGGQFRICQSWRRSRISLCVNRNLSTQCAEIERVCRTFLREWRSVTGSSGVKGGKGATLFCLKKLAGQGSTLSFQYSRNCEGKVL